MKHWLLKILGIYNFLILCGSTIPHGKHRNNIVAIGNLYGNELTKATQKPKGYRGVHIPYESLEQTDWPFFFCFFEQNPLVITRQTTQRK